MLVGIRNTNNAPFMAYNRFDSNHLVYPQGGEIVRFSHTQLSRRFTLANFDEHRVEWTIRLQATRQGHSTLYGVRTERWRPGRNKGLDFKNHVESPT